ncbi:MAG: transporter [Deltaproteobacteria bacterium]|nr:transporter [Deltaproteobacteria bacterium]
MPRPFASPTVPATLAVLAVLAVLVTGRPAKAQGPDGGAELTSDRPTFASTTGTSPAGRLTTELGVAVTFADNLVLDLPNASLRLGALPWLEVRLGGMNAVFRFDDTAGTDFGIETLRVGTKLGGSPIPGLAIATILEIRLPTATDGFGAPEAVPSFELIIDYALTNWLTVTANGTGRVRATYDDVTMETERFPAGLAGLAFMAATTDRLSLYMQGYVKSTDRHETAVVVGGGLTYLVLPRMQIDAGFDSRVTDTGPAPTVRAGTTFLY